MVHHQKKGVAIIHSDGHRLQDVSSRAQASGRPSWSASRPAQREEPPSKAQRCYAVMVGMAWWGSASKSWNMFKYGLYIYICSICDLKIFKQMVKGFW